MAIASQPMTLAQFLEQYEDSAVHDRLEPVQIVLGATPVASNRLSAVRFE